MVNYEIPEEGQLKITQTVVEVVIIEEVLNQLVSKYTQRDEVDAEILRLETIRDAYNNINN